MSYKKGLLIVFEGCDRSGKSTQSKLLYEYMKQKDISVELMSFPNRNTDIGILIDKYLKGLIFLSDETIHLLFSANRWEFANEIKTKLNNGTIIILDRYIYSGLVFSMSKKLDYNWCINSDTGLPTPDIIFFMDLKPSKLCERKDFGNEKYESEQFQNIVYENYINIFKNFNNVTFINSEEQIQEIHKKILFKINEN